MSSGHRHSDLDFAWAKKEYHAALGSERFRRYLYDSKFRVNRDYDIPYLAGYSRDGRTVYVDRHLPLSLRFGGALVAILPFLVTHERTEKGLIDFLDLNYGDAHQVATFVEHQQLIRAKRSPTLYEKALDPYIKADAHEKIVRVPPDLDLKPYRDSGDRRLLERMQDKMGERISSPRDEERSLLFIRHGATASNEEARERGWHDEGLDADGRAEVERLAAKLADSGLKVIVHSDLKRAKETAEKIAETTGAKLIPSMLLRTWGLGDLTGELSSKAKPLKDRHVLKYPDKPLPGGGESFNVFKRRAFRGMLLANSLSEGQKYGVVSHHSVERVVRSWQANGSPRDLSVKPEVYLKGGEETAQFEKMTIDFGKLRRSV